MLKSDLQNESAKSYVKHMSQLHRAYLYPALTDHCVILGYFCNLDLHWDLGKIDYD